MGGKGFINPEQGEDRDIQIEQSKKAREHFFTSDYKNKLSEKIANLTPKEQEKMESLEDVDMVTWYNRTKVTDENVKKLKTIPGCFYKVRA